MLNSVKLLHYIDTILKVCNFWHFNANIVDINAILIQYCSIGKMLTDSDSNIIIFIIYIHYLRLS